MKEFRGRGVGAGILGRLLEEAERRGLAEVYLHAQTHAIEFYGRFGFRAEGEEFMEADIPHYRMRRALGGRP
jgi:predicted GNAT family N-acyltransferase